MTSLVRVTGYLDRIRKFTADRTVVATLGSFDGLHRGHRQLFNRVSEISTDLNSDSSTETVTGALSFFPHPALVLKKAPQMPMLTSHRQKLRQLQGSGLDYFCIMRFTRELGEMSAHDFSQKILRDLFHVDTLVVGEDAAIGKGREGDVDFLQSYLPDLGIRVEVCSFLNVDDGRISSGRIRKALAEGSVLEATRLLGRQYEVESRIVRGDGRGRTIGFPTVNLQATNHIVPARGVYAIHAQCGPNIYGGVVNIGVRPTFNGTEERIEAHLLDTETPPTYGERIQIRFVDRLRDEQKFGSATELKSQIALDIQSARNVLKSI